MKSAVIILGVIGLAVVAIVLLALKYIPEGCEDCGEWSSCLHCPSQGTARCPMLRRHS